MNEPSDSAVSVSTRPTTGRTGGEWVRVRRKRTAARRRHRQRLAVGVVGGLVVLVAAYLLVTALLARRALEQARGEVTRLRAQISSGDLDGARATAESLGDDASTAHDLTTGPIWAGAAALPGGGPLDSIRRIAAGVDLAGGQALPKLVEATDVIDPSTLRSSDGSINLSPIAAAAPDLTAAAEAMDSAARTVQAAPSDTWLGAVDTARATLVDQLTSLSRTVDGAAIAARVAPVMLGADGPKNYLIAFQTEAELRGTGGLPGAFAIVHADHGKLGFTKFEADSTLTGTTTDLDFGPQYDQLWAGADATEEYADSNVSPHFPYAARIWTTMWRNYSGQHLDGALAVDPTALSYLLGATGPVTLADKTVVSASNVVDLTQRQVYAKYTKSGERKSYQLGIAKAIADHLIQGGGNTTSLLRAAGRAAGERRLLAWSSDPSVEADLAGTTLGGAVPESSAPFVGLAVNNSAATKLDYYANAALKWQRTGCGDTRDVTVTITVANNAPADLPTYVYGMTGRPGLQQRRGENRLLVSYFASSGALLKSVQLDGKTSAIGSGLERGHPVFTTNLLLKRGQTSTITLHLTEPAGRGAPVVLPQPMVRPLQVSVTDQKCG